MNAILVFVIFLGSCGESALSMEYSCDFMDSINITGGKLNDIDRSIVYQNRTFTSNQYSWFDFKIIDGSTREAAPNHLRGCPCKIKPCVRLLCPPGFEGFMCRNYTGFVDYTVNVLKGSNRTENVKIFEHFGYVYDRPCEKFLKKSRWNLTEVSTSIELNFEKYFSAFSFSLERLGR